MSEPFVKKPLFWVILAIAVAVAVIALYFVFFYEAPLRGPLSITF